ncbi:MAG: PhoH family protein [Candidatus Competibacter sp.]|nr:PhoH family protein [Candidatus Competibacter sp.]
MSVTAPPPSLNPNVSPKFQDLLLEPADNVRLANLCGNLDEHLRQVERRLGVEINNRGHQFRVIGDPSAVAVAVAVLEALYRSTGAEALTPARVHLFLQEAGAEALIGDEETEADEVLIRTRRGLIRGRGPNQQRYLWNIQHHDLNFGVGPAGTGKTYLAVACAVDALESNVTRRLVLVRPAVEAGERLGFLPGDMAQKIDPYLRPLYDALYEMLGFERVAKLIERNIIEVAPLAFMRGRAQPLTTPVLTENGWREMGSLQVGDYVVGSNGHPTQVLGVYPQGRKPVYRVTLTDGASTLCCAEHLWVVYTASDKRRHKPPRILATQAMMGNLRAAHQHRYELPVLSDPVRYPERDVPLDPYALGLLLGDGCITTSTTPSFSSQDSELVEALARALAPHAVIPTHRNGSDYVLKHTQASRGGLRIPNPVTVILRDLELAGTRSGTKFIPELYLRNSVQVRLGVLQGLLDTDGNACAQQGRTCRIQYVTTSERLKEDVIDLVRSLGGVARHRARKAEGRKPGFANGRDIPYRADAFVLDIRLPAGMNPFRLTRKAEPCAKYGAGRPMRFITNIEPAGEAETQCIRVDASDHLYVTEEFILTHNTLNDSFIILDEAQNTTVEQMKMFLTRIGFGSTAVVTGDVTQVDLPRNVPSGLRQVLQVLEDVDGISMTFFNARDVVRHPLVQRIVNAYQVWEQNQEHADRA